MIHNEHGIDGIALSMPAVVGEDGVQTKVPISLSEKEKEKLKKSADTLAEVLKGLDI
jgi:L-lactate dehydrogenase